jgi:hypothetical protein
MSLNNISKNNKTREALSWRASETRRGRWRLHKHGEKRSCRSGRRIGMVSRSSYRLRRVGRGNGVGELKGGQLKGRRKGKREEGGGNRFLF